MDTPDPRGNRPGPQTFTLTQTPKWNISEELPALTEENVPLWHATQTDILTRHDLGALIDENFTPTQYDGVLRQGDGQLLPGNCHNYPSRHQQLDASRALHRSPFTNCGIPQGPLARQHSGKSRYPGTRIHTSRARRRHENQGLRHNTPSPPCPNAERHIPAFPKKNNCSSHGGRTPPNHLISRSRPVFQGHWNPTQTFGLPTTDP